jgi:4-hydroxy-3-methylbut-2-enyl diphosphate reductase
VDATCPRVKASQIKARALSEGGYTIFLAGERDHGELVGIRGYVTGDCFVVAGPAEAAAAAGELARRKPRAKTALLGQTTISPGEYAGIGEAIRPFFPDLEIVDSICAATGDRQEALRELCGQVDAVLVAGGRESANTRRLLAIAGASGKKAWLVENAAEIPPGAAAFPVIGLSAGASTPDETVDEIERVLLG